MHKGHFKCLGAVALLVITVALAIWTISMYRSSLTNYRQIVDKCLAQATDEELKIRTNLLGYNFEHWFNPYRDTSTYITKTLQSKDTIIHIQINKNDPGSLSQVRQFMGKHSHPLNVTHVDSLFRIYMAEETVPVQSSYVEYLDLENHRLIESNAPKGKLSGYIASDTDTLDILKTIGVKAYAKTPVYVILKPVMWPFLASVVLVIIGLLCVIKLVRDIQRLRKEGFRILRSFAKKIEQPVAQMAKQVDATTRQLRKKAMLEEAETMERTYTQLVDAGNYAGRLWKYLDNEAGKIFICKTPVRLLSIFEELQEQFEETTHKSVKVTVNCDHNLMLNTDEMYLTPILTELMNNSVKFSDDEIHINLKGWQDGRNIYIHVSDNGWGIPKSEYYNIFEFAYKLEKHARKLKEENGIGLGLSFVKSFMHSLGGDIHLLSSEDDFTVFELAFMQTPEDTNMINNYRNAFN